jgi:hypothetical protein
MIYQTYYVRHPDDSYSEADPQPLPRATLAQAEAVQGEQREAVRICPEKDVACCEVSLKCRDCPELRSERIAAWNSAAPPQPAPQAATLRQCANPDSAGVEEDDLPDPCCEHPDCASFADCAASQAEHRQEAVAYILPSDLKKLSFSKDVRVPVDSSPCTQLVPDSTVETETTVPLYTTPQAQQWVPLTEAERKEILQTGGLDSVLYCTETKLREKNAGGVK